MNQAVPFNILYSCSTSPSPKQPPAPHQPPGADAGSTSVANNPTWWKLKRHLGAQKGFLNMRPGFSKLTRGFECYVIHCCSSSASEARFGQTHPPLLLPSPPAVKEFSQLPKYSSQKATPIAFTPDSTGGCFFSCREASCMTSPISNSTGSLLGVLIDLCIKPHQSDADSLADPSIPCSP